MTGRPLLERHGQLETVLSFAESARRGEGRLVLIEAPAGLGKTSLLTEACACLAELGHSVLRARGHEMEQEFPHGVVRQLLERVLADTTVRAAVLSGAAAAAAPVFDLDADATGPAFAVLHGLYWAVANLAQHRPLVLAVDDLHLADLASLRLLVHLARRLGDLPVLVLVATRPAAQAGPNASLDELRREAGDGLIALAPLSASAVGRLVEEALGEPADPRFTNACEEATGGNPFYLGELLRDAAGRGLAPTAANAAAVTRSGPPSIVHGLLLRMGTLPAEALPLARACAVLGAGHRLGECAALAGLSADAAALAADALAAAGVLVPSDTLEFRHPILHAAVLSDLGAHEERQWHSRAARLLADGGAEPRRIAAHLLRRDPDGDPATVQVLRDAAAAATRTGAPGAAAAYLRRALAEPPDERVRADVLFELGTVEAALGEDVGREHLAAATAATTDPVTRAARSAVLADVTARAGHLTAALQVLSHAITALDDPADELSLELAATRFFTARLDLSTSAEAERYRGDLEQRLDGPDTAARRQLLVYLAIDAAAGRSRVRAAELLTRALAPPGLLSFVAPESMAVGMALYGLSAIEQHADFHALADAAAVASGTRGALMGLVSVSMFRAMEYLHCGRLVEAETEARAALDAPGRRGWHQSATGLVGSLGIALFEQGRYDEAAGALEEFARERDDARDYTTMVLLDLRGRLQIAAGATRAGLAKILQCGLRADEYAMRNPALLPWRGHAADALLALGDRAEAQRLATAEVDAARRLAGPIAEGAALRVLARTTATAERTELLRTALDLLDQPAARLERARVLLDLGSVERRAGAIRPARERLHAALQLATLCHATTLAEQCRLELLAAGARAPRTRAGADDELTASELRVARLAAQGLSNTSIAQTLFISRKTVEKHLANSYRKLGITSRTELDTRVLDG